MSDRQLIWAEKTCSNYPERVALRGSSKTWNNSRKDGQLTKN